MIAVSLEMSDEPFFLHIAILRLFYDYLFTIYNVDAALCGLAA